MLNEGFVPSDDADDGDKERNRKNCIDSFFPTLCIISPFVMNIWPLGDSLFFPSHTDWIKTLLRSKIGQHVAREGTASAFVGIIISG